MKTLTSFLFGVLLFVSVETQAADWTVDYCEDLTEGDFGGAARRAFHNRKFVIQSHSDGSVIGVLKGKKVEIAREGPGKIVIRWVPGFGHRKDNWLKNLKYDVLWDLAGEQEPGEWTIKWCEDLEESEFRKAAKWAFYKRKYVIEADTGNSVIGSQREKKVEIIMVEPGRILVRWVPGFGYEKDNWLKNLWRDVSVALAG